MFYCSGMSFECSPSRATRPTSLSESSDDAHAVAQERTIIAIPTAGRPESLGRLLAALAADYGPRPDVSLLVVDNDPGGSSRQIFAECARGFGDRGKYVVEATRGYASVRNAILANVGDATLVAMIDDDEIPLSHTWLDELLDVQRATHADVVVGAVVSELPAEAPAWFRASRVFSLESPNLPEGTEMKWCASNNTLVRSAAARGVPGGFAQRFNATGGEDTDFFCRVHLAGGKIVWTNRATVSESVSPDRLSYSWVFRRATRSGNSRSLVELQLGPRPRVFLMRTLKATGLIGYGCLCAVRATLRRDRALALNALYRVGQGVGMLAALASRRPWGGKVGLGQRNQ